MTEYEGGTYADDFDNNINSNGGEGDYAVADGNTGAAASPSLFTAHNLLGKHLSFLNLVTGKENRQRVGKRIGKKSVTKIGIETGKGIGTGKKAGTGIEIGRRTEIGIVTVTTGIEIGSEIGIGIVVNEGNEVETEMMMMIILEAGIMIGVEITTGTEMTGTGVALDLTRGVVLLQKVDLRRRVDLSAGQDHALVHAPRGILGFVIQEHKRPSGFDMAPPAPAMLPIGATAVGQIAGATPALAGMFPNMFPQMTGQPFNTLPIMPAQAMTQQATRHARRVYVGGLPPTANEQSVATYFNQVMAAIGGNTAGPGDAVVNVYINHDKKFAFVEMRSVEEASNAMALDGIIFEGAPVKVRRPTDYNPSLAATLGPSQPNPNLNLGAVGLTPGSAGGLEGPDRIFVGGLPYYFTEAQVRELLESFGPLRGFDLVKDRETGNSKGYAFCVYQDVTVTDIACAALNGIKMGDKTLTVRRANQGTNQPKPEQENVLLHAKQQIALQGALLGQPSIMQRLMLQPAATKVVCLTQVVTEDELRDDQEYEDILEDMRLEGGKFGNLLNVVIPRPNPEGGPSPGVGKVFLEYGDTDGAARARAGMNGRKFGGNEVVAVFYDENTPKVNREEAHSPDDVQRLYIVLRPESGDHPVEDKQEPDSGKEGSKTNTKTNNKDDTASTAKEGGHGAQKVNIEKEKLMRFIVMGRKSLPDPSKKGRPFWGFVDLVTTNLDHVKDALKPKEYQTSTRGKRHEEAARAAGEGIYRILRHNGKKKKMHTHLVYKLELPAEGKQHEPQEALNIEREGSFVIQIKNPDAGGGSSSGSGFGGLQKKRRAQYPAHLQGQFGRSKRYGPADPPDLLNYEGCEFLMISAADDIEEELGLELKTEECGRGGEEEELCSDLVRDFGDVAAPTPLLEGTWA
ncbi:Splicing factor U2af large subunit B [Linum grandiflorum]